MGRDRVRVPIRVRVTVGNSVGWEGLLPDFELHFYGTVGQVLKCMHYVIPKKCRRLTRYQFVVYGCLC